jgi:CO/xanthine dehydrogenase FAD-binding subunit
VPKIGSLVTLRAIETSPVVKEKFGILSQAASKVGSLQLRHRESIGGNICPDARCPHFNQPHQWQQSFQSCFKTGGEVYHEDRGGKRCFAVCSADTAPALANAIYNAVGIRIKDLPITPDKILRTSKRE